MKAVISADELAKDVAGAEALLESHQEHRVCLFFVYLSAKGQRCLAVRAIYVIVHPFEPDSRPSLHLLLTTFIHSSFLYCLRQKMFSVMTITKQMQLFRNAARHALFTGVLWTECVQKFILALQFHWSSIFQILSIRFEVIISLCILK